MTFFLVARVEVLYRPYIFRAIFYFLHWAFSIFSFKEIRYDICFIFFILIGSDSGVGRISVCRWVGGGVEVQCKP